MAEAYVFLADGFEEIEGLTVVDLLRRAGIETQMVSVMEGTAITGSHGIRLEADLTFDTVDADTAQLFVLPGGMPGTKYLAAHEGLGVLLKKQMKAGKRIAAICAAPSVLGGLGILNGRTATSYPGFEEQMTGATVTTNPVEISGNVTTSRGMGTAIPFALALVAQMRDQKTADQLAASIIYG